MAERVLRHGGGVGPTVSSEWSNALRSAAIQLQTEKSTCENDKGLQPFDCNPLNSLKNLAERTGLEPATPGVTGRYSNQLNYHSW